MLNPSQTALVLIDLQQGILGYGQAPCSGAELVQRTAPVVARFRAAGALIVRVKVGWSEGYPELLRQTADLSAAPPADGLPADWWADPAGLPTQPGDLLITKRQWNAFHGTELDLQLRRRGITTLVFGGIATHIGVEGSVRAAWELSYQLYIADDLCSGPVAEAHQGSMRYVMPRLGHVRPSAAITLG